MYIHFHYADMYLHSIYAMLAIKYRVFEVSNARADFLYQFPPAENPSFAPFAGSQDDRRVSLGFGTNLASLPFA